MDDTLKGIIPSAENEVKSLRISWNGLDRKHPFGSRSLSDCENVSSYYAPYLSTAETPSFININKNGEDYALFYPLSVYSYCDFLVISSIEYKFFIDNPVFSGSNKLISGTYVFALNYKIMLFRPSDKKKYFVKYKSDNNYLDFSMHYYPGTPNLSDGHEITSDEINELYLKCGEYLDSVHDNIDVAITGFQSYPENGKKIPVTEEPSKTLIIGLAYDYNDFSNSKKRKLYSATLNGGYYEANEITATDGLPPIRFLSTHQGRVWGADKTVVSASAYANYANWETDLSYLTNQSDGYGASHAWISSLQADNYSSGDVTAIFNFLGNLIVFRNDYMFEVSGTKNPFRVNDIFNIGTIDSRSVASCAGFLFFVGVDGVYAYSGNIPECISDNLDIRQFIKAVAASDDRFYYLYAETVRNSGVAEKKIYVFDTKENSWSIRSLPNSGGVECIEICGIARVDRDIFALAKFEGNGYFCNTHITGDLSWNVNTFGGMLFKLNSLEYSNINWFADTEISANDSSGSVSANPKRVKEIRLIAEMSKNTALKVFVKKADESLPKFDIPSKIYENNTEHSLILPIVLKIFGGSCFGYKIRIAGSGFVRVYSLEVIYADGGYYTKTDKDGITKS